MLSSIVATSSSGMVEELKKAEGQLRALASIIGLIIGIQ